MTIEYVVGDIFDSDAEAIVNTVNCIGVMGGGLALQFKHRYPGMYQEYRKDCAARLVRVGKMHVYKLPEPSTPQYIINFPTKDDFKYDSKMEYIDDGLKDLVRQIETLGIKSIAIPPLGCGLGGLNWTEVYPKIENALRTLPSVQVIIYCPL